MNLFDILSHDERVVVLSNAADGCIYTWNLSLTLQCWLRQGSQGYDHWIEVSVRTLSDEPRNFWEAKDAALQWQGDMWKEEDTKNETPKPHRRRRKKATCKHPYLP